ncbi:ENDUC protein, partial [Leptocoma aspasia]|nr:ENDUC protein [Leptocoma aspasia]
RLFSYVSPALLARPTFSRLLALLDNYEPRTGRPEEETAEERREQREFLGAALGTPVLALLQRFVLSKGGAALSPRCPHGVPSVSTVFPQCPHAGLLGVLSLRFRWDGRPRPGCPPVCPLHDTPCDPAMSPPQWTGFPDVLSLRFRWDGHSKARGSLLVGSSPELDLALFTLCFLARPDSQCHISLGGEAATIQTYTWDKQRLVASAYPLTPQ